MRLDLANTTMVAILACCKYSQKIWGVMATHFCFVHQVDTLLQRTDHSFLLYIVFVNYIYMCACLCITAGIASTVRVLAV